MKESIVLAALVALSVFAVVFVSGCTSVDGGSNLPPVPDGVTGDEGNDGGPVIESIPLAEVSEHGSKDDCWLAIDGKVYDVTAFISSHPGQDAILEGCGKDASSLFNQRTREDGSAVGSGSPHSQNARNLLPAYYIGDVEQ